MIWCVVYYVKQSWYTFCSTLFPCIIHQSNFQNIHVLTCFPIWVVPCAQIWIVHYQNWAFPTGRHWLWFHSNKIIHVTREDHCKTIPQTKLALRMKVKDTGVPWKESCLMQTFSLTLEEATRRVSLRNPKVAYGNIVSILIHPLCTLCVIISNYFYHDLCDWNFRYVMLDISN